MNKEEKQDSSVAFIAYGVVVCCLIGLIVLFQVFYKEIKADMSNNKPATEMTKEEAAKQEKWLKEALLTIKKREENKN